MYYESIWYSSHPFSLNILHLHKKVYDQRTPQFVMTRGSQVCWSILLITVVTGLYITKYSMIYCCWHCAAAVVNATAAVADAAPPMRTELLEICSTNEQRCSNNINGLTSQLKYALIDFLNYILLLFLWMLILTS